MYVVIVKDYYNDCGVGGFSCAVGPFATLEEAEERAAAINRLKHYATKADAEKLEEKYWSEKSS